MKLTMATLVWLVSSCLLLLIWGSTSLPKAYAMPPPSPVDCDATGCKLHNSYGVWNDRKECWVQNVIYPTTEEELRLAVAETNRKKLKAKIITGFSHTIPKLACPGNELSKNSVLISTAKYNSGIQVDVKSLTVTADSGVGLRDLINKVEEAGLSLVASPYWEGVSIGGLISTGAHGSSWWGKGGAVHDHVVALSLVVPAKESEGYAKIIQLDSRNQIFNAAKLSLGVLGAISRSITNVYSNDSHFEDEFMDLAKKHEFADITWNPSKHAVIYRQDDRKALETSRNVNGKCLMANTVVGYKKLVANGLKNNNLLFTGYPVVGRQGKMQTSGSCLIKGLFFYETTAIFPASKFRNFIQDVKKLRDLKPEHFCGVDIYNGFLIRFIKASDAYLGQPEDSVVVDFNYYRANEASTPRLNQDIWEEVEQIAFFKYGAKPHWAKNRNLAFFGVQQKYPNFCKFLHYWSDKIIFGNETEKAEGCAMEGMCICSEDKHLPIQARDIFANQAFCDFKFVLPIKCTGSLALSSYFAGRDKFLEAKKQLDPENMFSGDWSDEILFGNEAAKPEGCAMEGLCICSEDKHCNPSKGYLCKPGIIYNEARVCRFSAS
ncbi:hypothetical protein MKW92_006301 [Papaver armeniacum]|nr:hypothetical protein MKW92_006301 [Papaver armeniacum]